MAVKKEFRCLAHGPFESSEERCPRGCTTVVREFRTAPGMRSPKTRASDAALERLAKQFGYSDMSNKNGSVGSGGKPASGAPDMRPQWLDLPKNKDREDKTDVITPALASLRVQTGKVGDEPSFMDISKTLSRPRPHAVASFGTARDLDEAQAKA